MLLFVYGFLSGFVFVILVLVGLGVYAKSRQEQMVRYFIRRSMRSAMPSKDAANK